MSFVRLAPLLLLVLPAAASAQSMNAEIFNQRAIALQKKGPMALFSRGEIKALMTEGQAAATKARENRLAAAAPGRSRATAPRRARGRWASDEYHERPGRHPRCRAREDRHDRGDDAHPARASFPARG